MLVQSRLRAEILQKYLNCNRARLCAAGGSWGGNRDTEKVRYSKPSRYVVGARIVHRSSLNFHFNFFFFYLRTRLKWRQNGDVLISRALPTCSFLCPFGERSSAKMGKERKKGKPDKRSCTSRPPQRTSATLAIQSESNERSPPKN